MIEHIKQLLSNHGGTLTAQIWFLGDNDSQRPTKADLIGVDEVGIVRVQRGSVIVTPWHQIEAINFGEAK